MDFRRYFLWGALFISGYLLFLQWSQDYGPQSTQSVAQSTQTETNSQVSDDLPLASQSTTDANAEVPQNVTSVAPGKLIEVTTDTLRVAINPVGGDLVKAALLNYKKELGQPDSFVILEDNTERTYITQS
ncbi:MAG: membrane protein insertase YidC, partial [Marinomonas sp.]